MVDSELIKAFCVTHKLPSNLWDLDPVEFKTVIRDAWCEFQKFSRREVLFDMVRSVEVGKMDGIVKLYNEDFECLDGYDPKNLVQAKKDLDFENAHAEVLHAKQLLEQLLSEKDALTGQINLLNARLSDVKLLLKKFDTKTK